MSSSDELIEEQGGSKFPSDVSGTVDAPSTDEGGGGHVPASPTTAEAEAASDAGADETPRTEEEGAAAGESAAVPEEPPPPPAKKTPAEAFGELTEAIRSMHADFSIAMEGVRASHDLVQRVDRDRLLGDRAALDALARIHGLTFKYVQAHAAEAADPNSFAHTLLQLVEGEFQNLGVGIIRPHPDDPVDYGMMEAIGTAPCRFWQKAGRVAEVERCGFALQTPDGFRVLHKAKVVVRSRDAREESGE